MAGQCINRLSTDESIGQLTDYSLYELVESFISPECVNIEQSVYDN